VGLFAAAVDCERNGSSRAGLEGNVGDSDEDEETDLGKDVNTKIYIFRGTMQQCFLFLLIRSSLCMLDVSIVR
jgi:hypothetical protein